MKLFTLQKRQNFTSAQSCLRDPSYLCVSKLLLFLPLSVLSPSIPSREEKVKCPQRESVYFGLSRFQNSAQQVGWRTNMLMRPVQCKGYTTALYHPIKPASGFVQDPLMLLPKQSEVLKHVCCKECNKSVNALIL